jgi:hypothetical protein
VKYGGNNGAEQKSVHECIDLQPSSGHSMERNEHDQDVIDERFQRSVCSQGSSCGWMGRVDDRYSGDADEWINARSESETDTVL